MGKTQINILFNRKNLMVKCFISLTHSSLIKVQQSLNHNWIDPIHTFIWGTLRASLSIWYHQTCKFSKLIRNYWIFYSLFHLNCFDVGFKRNETANCAPFESLVNTKCDFGWRISIPIIACNAHDFFFIMYI